MTDEIYYRVEDPALISDWLGNNICKPLLRKYIVMKHTHCGVWVIPTWCAGYTSCENDHAKSKIKKNKKFILNNSHKKFAYPTVEQAIASYALRKKRQQVILKARLEETEAYVKIAESLTNKNIVGNNYEEHIFDHI